MFDVLRICEGSCEGYFLSLIYNRSNLENFGKMIRKLKERKFFFNDEDEDILEDILWKFSKEIVI